MLGLLREAVVNHPQMNRAQIRLIREQLMGMNTYDLSPLQLRAALLNLCDGPKEKKS